MTSARRLGRLIGGTLLAAVAAGHAQAVELYSSDRTTIRWDNTVKYSAALRLSQPLPALIRDPNSDDGDRNFQPGVISNRLDALSELDIAFTSGETSWGGNVSAAAWYDTIYNGATDAAESSPPGFYPPFARFAPPVRDLHGRHAELLNGYMYVVSGVAGMPASIRIGRHTVLWGESLFFAGNGIAAGQAPIDTIKALSVPVTRAKEIYMPVNQVSLNLQPTPSIAINAYYQFEWRKSRLPGAGSYFGAADFVDRGGYLIYVGPNRYLSRTQDTPAPDHGQFGVSARVTGSSFDYGFYALRYHAREPQIYLRPNPPVIAPAERRERTTAYGAAPGIFYGPSNPLQILFPGGFGSARGSVGGYNLVYPEGIEIYGASFSGYLGDANLAGEFSTRRRMPLISTALVIPPDTPGDAQPDADDSPFYARGNTLHAQVSLLTSFTPTSLWESASFAAEIAATHRLKVTRNLAALDATRDRSAAIVSAVFEPRYFAVLPGLDLGVPAGVAYGLAGRSSVDGSQTAGAGSVSLGISATYRAVWSATLGVTHFIGGLTRQPFTDRDFVAFSLQRTF